MKQYSPTFALTQIGETSRFPNIKPQKNPISQQKKGSATTLGSSSLQTARKYGPVIPKNNAPQTQRSFSVKTNREVPERLRVNKKEDSDFGAISNLIKQIENDVSAMVDSMYRVSTPRTLEKKIKQIETGRQSKVIIGQLSKHILKTKNTYNNLAYEKKQKLNQQHFLKEQIANLQVATIDSEILQNRLKDIEEKHSQILQLIENEKYQTEILAFMKTNRKAQNMKLQEPIGDLRKQMQVKSREIVETDQEAYRKLVSLKGYEIECQQVINEVQSIRDKREQIINQDLKVFQERQLVMKIFQKEQEKDLENQCQKIDILRSVDEDNKRRTTMEEEMLDKELQKNDEYIQRQENLFKQIKQVTSVNSIQDMLPHLKYLQQTEQNLKQAVANTKKTITGKHQLLELLTKEKQQIFFLTSDKKEVSAPDLLDNQLYDQDKKLRDTEKKFQYYNKLVASSNAVINKMGSQLADQDTDCKPENLSEYLSELGMKLETMLQAIDKRQLEPLDQSLLEKPPAFLNINEKQYVQEEQQQYESKGMLQQINVQQDEEHKFLQEAKIKIKLKEDNTNI